MVYEFLIEHKLFSGEMQAKKAPPQGRLLNGEEAGQPAVSAPLTTFTLAPAWKAGWLS